MFDGFPPATLNFLRELASNNDREWFAANKERYERSVLEPSLAFITAMQSPLKKISPFFVAIPKRQGGSLMRIYRDVRFSANKQPYKTNIGIHFRHEAGRDVHAPGLYLHLATDEIFVGAGMWRPDRDALASIRESIADNPSAWRRASRSKRFLADWELTGESLKRAPVGYAVDDPQIEDIKRKDFIGVSRFDRGAETKPCFLDDCVSRFACAKPLLRFLGDAVQMPC